MELDQALLVKLLGGGAARMKGAVDQLSEIDSRFGDGDHGITIQKIALCMEKALAHWQDENPAEFLAGLGQKIMALNGGSAGPLWGTFIGGLGLGWEAGASGNRHSLKAMLAFGLSELQEITKAGVGDKTMMDALIPAVEAAQQAPDQIPTVLAAAAAAADQGARDTEKYMAKFGRAKSYKEQTLGTRDAGAVSLALFFMGMWESLNL